MASSAAAISAAALTTLASAALAGANALLAAADGDFSGAARARTLRAVSDAARCAAEPLRGLLRQRLAPALDDCAAMLATVAHFDAPLPLPPTSLLAALTSPQLGGALDVVAAFERAGRLPPGAGGLKTELQVLLTAVSAATAAAPPVDASEPSSSVDWRRLLSSLAAADAADFTVNADALHRQLAAHGPPAVSAAFAPPAPAAAVGGSNASASAATAAASHPLAYASTLAAARRALRASTSSDTSGSSTDGPAAAHSSLPPQWQLELALSVVECITCRGEFTLQPWLADAELRLLAGWVAAHHAALLAAAEGGAPPLRAHLVRVALAACAVPSAQLLPPELLTTADATATALLRDSGTDAAASCDALLLLSLRDAAGRGVGAIARGFGPHTASLLQLEHAAAPPLAPPAADAAAGLSVSFASGVVRLPPTAAAPRAATSSAPASSSTSAPPPRGEVDLAGMMLRIRGQYAGRGGRGLGLGGDVAAGTRRPPAGALHARLAELAAPLFPGPSPTAVPGTALDDALRAVEALPFTVPDSVPRETLSQRTQAALAAEAAARKGAAPPPKVEPAAAAASSAAAAAEPPKPKAPAFVMRFADTAKGKGTTADADDDEGAAEATGGDAAAGAAPAAAASTARGEAGAEDAAYSGFTGSWRSNSSGCGVQSTKEATARAATANAVAAQPLPPRLPPAVGASAMRHVAADRKSVV